MLASCSGDLEKCSSAPLPADISRVLCLVLCTSFFLSDVHGFKSFLDPVVRHASVAGLLTCEFSFVITIILSNLQFSLTLSWYTFIFVADGQDRVITSCWQQFFSFQLSHLPN